MLDPAITEFFSERKEIWLKKRLKPDMTDIEVRDTQLKCAEEFALDKWLPSAAKRAGQMTISTHPCTFSHPSARKNKNGYVTSVIANSHKRSDGYFRTGNTSVSSDALGNAAVLDVYKFLSITTSDNKTVLEHIQNDSKLARELLNVRDESYASLRDGFMAMVSSDQSLVTSSKIKQVYFPVDNDYHQLSILSNSGMIFELRRRIDVLRFSDSVKEKRELRRKNEYSETGYAEIYDVTTIAYGGSKPQNVSVLNNQNAGKAYILASLPPIIELRNIKFPSKDFFVQSMRHYDCKDVLERLDRILKVERDGQIPLEKARKGRDRCLGDVIDLILQKMMVLREVSAQQFWPHTTKLPVWQQIWLCEQYKEQRQDEHAWLDSVSDRISHWIADAYKTCIKSPVLLGQAERYYIKSFVSDNKEVLR